MLRRKKSKYKHAVVGGKKYYLYRLYWLDMFGHLLVTTAKLLYSPTVMYCYDQAFTNLKE